MRAQRRSSPGERDAPRRPTSSTARRPVERQGAKAAGGLAGGSGGHPLGGGRVGDLALFGRALFRLALFTFAACRSQTARTPDTRFARTESQMSRLYCTECGSADRLEEDCGDGKLYCSACHDEWRPDSMRAETMECQICFDAVPRSETLPLCKHRHRFCYECCWRCCQSALGEGLVPACPSDKESKCGVLGKGVAERALSVWLGSRGKSQARKAELGSTWAIRGSTASGFTSGKLDEVYASAERAAQGAVQCPGRKCNAWYIPTVPHSTKPQRIVCAIDKCGMSFCSLCRHPYHFRTDCAEALRIQARWVKFLTEDLAPFLMAAIKVDPARYGAALKEHTRSKSALDDAAKDALRRFDELKQMELWKERHCRRCPHCRRVVEKMSGCDMMTCGSDAHGGNQQRGCGKPFVWTGGQPNSALPYHADLRSAAAEPAAEGNDDDGGDDGGESEAGRERRLRRDASEVHVVVAGAPLPCDSCGQELVGPRWQCLQCEGLVDLCIACVGRVAQGKALVLRDGRKHLKGHVFRRVRQAAIDTHAIVDVDVDDAEGLSAISMLQRMAHSGGGGGGEVACGSGGGSSSRLDAKRPRTMGMVATASRMAPIEVGLEDEAAVPAGLDDSVVVVEDERRSRERRKQRVITLDSDSDDEVSMVEVRRRGGRDSN